MARLLTSTPEPIGSEDLQEAIQTLIDEIRETGALSESQAIIALTIHLQDLNIGPVVRHYQATYEAGE